MFMNLSRMGRPWPVYISDILRGLLSFWFMLLAVACVAYWSDLSGWLVIGSFCLLAVSFWAMPRFLPKWVTALVSIIGLVAILTYFVSLLADPEVQAAINRRDDTFCSGAQADISKPIPPCRLPPLR